jgi:hypothetical protein
MMAGLEPDRDPRLLEIDAVLDGTPAGESEWYRRVQALIVPTYLAGVNERLQSGFGGDAEYWRLARGPIAEAIQRDGTLLDVGCANGLLMESLRSWVAERGISLEPYGLDLSPALAELARQRLPHWAERIFVGNALDWQPPRRFDYVRTELVYVPPGREADLIEHLLAEVVAPGGRLVVCSYGSSRRPVPRTEDIAARLRGMGFAVAGAAAGRAPNGVEVTRVAWLDSASQP